MQVTAAVGSSRMDHKKCAEFDECYQTAMLSDEEVLCKFPSFLGLIYTVSDIVEETQMAQWTSDVYQHFQIPPTITVKRGIVVYVYACIA